VPGPGWAFSADLEHWLHVQYDGAMPDDREQVACVELSALPLQLLLLDHPSWREHPVAVVEADRPQAKLLWVNERARALRVLPGMRFAAARSLAPQLRASVVGADRVERAVADLFALLLDFSPRIELDQEQQGTFWVDPSGMVLLWGDLGAWATALQEALSQAGYAAMLVVGFHRFRCLAIARAAIMRTPGVREQHANVWVISDRRREARMAASVPLDRLAISPRLRDDLAGLGVRTLGEFMALPGPELRVRFGVEAERLHQRGSDGHWAPLQARALVDPVCEQVELDPPEGDLGRLLFRIKPVLERLLEQLAGRGSAMSALHLRLDALQLRAPVESFALELEGQRADPRQIALFRAQVRRDLEAADRALARLCAALGPEAVTRAQLRPAHLPEARSSWVPVSHVRFPEARHMQIEGELGPRVRRVLSRPRLLPPRPRNEPDGWIIEPELGPVEQMHGPFRASGGWWVREVERDYYFAQTRSRTILWVFYDRPRRRWFMHGWLE
jgi:protein ImuB